ncbi:MAG TPA: YihY/virulence factor BrkB family protein [Gaiellaceae bacterium]|nr:YihY/virulence factor BrkB family protein [Gaiellaceae bacterium]
MRQKQDGPRAGLTRPSRRAGGRPEPDEAPPADDGPSPQPERREPPIRDPRLRDLSFADWKAIVRRAFKEFMADNAMMLASALAYSSFFAIPSVLIVATGLFTLIAGPQTIANLMQHLHGVIPSQAVTLLKGSLLRADAHPAGSIVATIFGFVVAVWSVTGAMNSYMTAINLAYNRKDRRSFVSKRIVALKMAGAIGFAFVLVAALTIFGPVVEHAISTRIGAAGGVLNILWWVAQWPILLVGLLAAFATLLYLGPDVDQPRWEWLTPGSLVAAFLWMAASGLFALYTASFASYNKTWGSLSAVIVMLTWLWLTAMALLLGAEINAEAERSRELRAT